MKVMRNPKTNLGKGMIGRGIIPAASIPLPHIPLPSTHSSAAPIGAFRLALVLLIGLTLRLVAAEPQGLTVAVFDFESKGEPVQDRGRKVSALPTATFPAEPQLLLVERAE